jgi:hypothetical protein
LENETSKSILVNYFDKYSKLTEQQDIKVTIRAEYNKCFRTKNQSSSSTNVDQKNSDVPTEVWKDIPGYEGKYQIGNVSARIKTIDINFPVADIEGTKRVLTNKNGSKSAYHIGHIYDCVFNFRATLESVPITS